MTNTARMRSAGTISAAWSTSSDKRGRLPGAGVEWRSDGPKKAAAAGAPTAAHGHVLPARGRRGDGVFGVERENTASGAGRWDVVPDQVRDIRGDRAARDAHRLAAEPGARPALYVRGADRERRDGAAGQGTRSGLWGRGRAPVEG